MDGANVERCAEMRLQELMAAVPVLEKGGRAYLIAIDTIPQPFRDQFARDLRGSACPIDERRGPCAFAWDWAAWCRGEWHGRGPMGLE